MLGAKESGAPFESPRGDVGGATSENGSWADPPTPCGSGRPGVVLAAAEAAVFLAIILSIYREFNSISPDETNTLRG